MSKDENNKNITRVMYFAGNGDVASTYQYWKKGVDDPNEVAVTYSSQFYDVCKKFDIDAIIISFRNRGTTITDGRFIITSMSTVQMQGSLSYHIANLLNSLKIWSLARRFQADVVFVPGGSNIFGLVMMAVSGIHVIPCLHCTFWPMGNRSRRPVTRFFQRLKGFFFRRFPQAVIAISPECARQVIEIARKTRCKIYTARPIYRKNRFKNIKNLPFWSTRPFRLIYAGRIEKNKGIMELIEAAKYLQSSYPGEFSWEICGDGSMLPWLNKEVKRQNLEGVVNINGKLDFTEMIDRYKKAHAVVIPTTNSFKEGLNKVAVEAVLTGTPAITSEYIPANELLAGATVLMSQDSSEGIVEAILSLANNEDNYLRCRSACFESREQFFSPSKSWGHAVYQILESLIQQNSATRG